MNKLLLVCLLVFAPVSLASADLKIAVVDLSKRSTNITRRRMPRSKLKEKQDGYQKEIAGSHQRLSAHGRRSPGARKAAKDPTLSPAARQDKSQGFECEKAGPGHDAEQDSGNQTERTREIQEELLRRHKEIVDEISKVITDYSGPQGYDLVIDKSSASAASGVSLVLYNSSKLTRYHTRDHRPPQ